MLAQINRIPTCSLLSFGRGVLGHTDHAYGRPWVKIDEHVTPLLAEIVGASLKSSQPPLAADDRASSGRRKAVRGGLHGFPHRQSAHSLHLILPADAAATQDPVRGQGLPLGRRAFLRFSSLALASSLPAAQYAFASHVALHDYPPSSLLPVFPREGEHTIRTDDILRIIEDEGDSIAVICFGAVQYYSGEWFDMEAITKAGQAKVRALAAPASAA